MNHSPKGIDYAEFGLVRVAAVAPPISLGNPIANAEIIADCYDRNVERSCSIVLTPELSLTGYTCEDLFLKDELLQQVEQALLDLAKHTGPTNLIVGAPCSLPDGRLLNCAFVMSRGEILGALPKQSNPNYGEFYERRWFSSGRNVATEVRYGDHLVQVDPKQLFAVGDTYFAIEICADLWLTQPTSDQQALQGATILLNLSASPELVAKADYRRDLVRIQSARCLAGYIYAGSGPTESTKDLIFGGHLIAAENGVMLGESDRFRFDENCMVVDIDTQKLSHERRSNSTFTESIREAGYKRRGVATHFPLTNHLRVIERLPFVPVNAEESDIRAEEIINIQTAGLARRIQHVEGGKMVIGLSGGLDSTLAFLICLEVLAKLDLPRTAVIALTLPGPGTTAHTLKTVHALCEQAEIALQELSIEDTVERHLQDLDHESRDDTVFENSQARERTQVLFDMANKVGGIVVGTGDLSELALGWCTYNADHMASYNVNAGVPKTLIKYLVRWYAENRASEKLSITLGRVLETPISPELLVSEEGEMSQLTEDLIGPFELHDFFLFHFLRNGSDVRKIFVWAQEAFSDSYTHEEIKHWLKQFFMRFFSQQFKRTTLPAGPKVGTVSLSPRGDWRMPDEVDSREVLGRIDEL